MAAGLSDIKSVTVLELLRLSAPRVQIPFLLREREHELQTAMLSVCPCETRAREESEGENALRSAALLRANLNYFKN